MHAVLKAAIEGKITEDWRAQHRDTEPALVLLERILTEHHREWEEDQLAKFVRAGKKPRRGGGEVQASLWTEDLRFINSA